MTHRVFQCSVCGEYYFESEKGVLTKDYYCVECGASYQSFVDVTDEFYNTNKS